MAGRHRARRSESFAVRRWLQLGAASAGMGAAMWGMSLVGPQVAAAAEDGGSSSSSVGSPSDTNSADQDNQTKAAANNADAADIHDSGQTSGDAASNPDDAGSDDIEDSDDTDDADDDEATVVEDSNTDSDDAPSTDQDDIDSNDADTDSADDVTTDAGPVANLVAGPTTESTEPTVEHADGDGDIAVAAAPIREVHPWGMKQEANKPNEWQQNTSDVIAATTANFDLIIHSLPLPPEIREALSGTLWTMRRTFFNLAPTMNQTYSVTSGEGEIWGAAKATDAEGDRIVYRLVQGPRFGTVELNADGSYTYTPSEGFDGVDTFVIAADDVGPHINLFEPFRGAGASSAILVNKDAIEFVFEYKDPDGLFTEERKNALNQSAKRLAAYFIVDQKTVLTYTVNSVNIPNGFLASAGSPISNEEDPGFWGTVVQEKLQTGIDANGAKADGHINWNWAFNWGLYPEVKQTEYDFTSTVMHELLHSFGWLDGMSNPPDLEENNWFTYDKFVSTRNGESPINPDTLQWNPDYTRNLTGYDGGMYFNGENAVAAFGGRPVPLYTPDVYDSGSSIGHLRDDVFYGPNHVMMNHAAASLGPDNISLSPVELGVLMDLGYTVVAFPWFAYPFPPPKPTPPAPEVAETVVL